MRNILIAGSGFAGMWSAFSAARARSQAGKERQIEITLISPSPTLHIRPRFYEASLENMAPDIAPHLAAIGVKHLAGTVESVDTDSQSLVLQTPDGSQSSLHYDRFILASGSGLNLPDIPGLKEYSFNVDQLDNAKKLDEHLKGLATQPDTAARNTVVVAGAGFTGIETVLELPQRLLEYLGDEATFRVVLLERASQVGPDLGPGPRPAIEEALIECGIEVRTSTAAASIDGNGVTTSTGEYIETNTVIWTAGPKAHSLAAQIEGEHDQVGRVHADEYLHAKGVKNVFVTGDVARAVADDQGNIAAMSCQHALSLGRVSGYNAAAELAGLPLHPYSQPKYVTCLDLGPWGAVYTEGWDRKIHLQKAEAKALKIAINTQWIYPPEPDRDAIFSVASPDYVIVP